MWGSGSIAACVGLILSSAIVLAHGDADAVSRQIRQTTPEYHIDILVLADNAVYQAWYGRTQTTMSPQVRRNETIQNIRRYFTLVIDEVSKLYSQMNTNFRLNFRPVGFYVDDQNGQSWTATQGTGNVDANTALQTLRDWLTQCASSLPAYDHAMLFTGENLASDDQGHTSGRATVNSMCKGNIYDSVSVIEDRGAFQSVFTAAHELGHTLNASHDGSNGCSSTDRYIMAAVGGSVTESKQRQPWFFSSCSQAEISQFVSSLTVQQVENCLQRQLEPREVPDITGVIPGQLYDVETQCQHLYGASSSFCFFGNLSTVCTALTCRDPTDIISNRCNKHVAASGTSCGNKQWCSFGQCVQSDEAPASGSCVKDQLTTVNGMTCLAMARSQPALCYQADVYDQCCQSCDNEHSGVDGCPYGNRLTGCGSAVCQRITPSGNIRDEDCCSTCNFDNSTWTCTDAPTVDGVSCEVALRRNGLQGCYNETLAFLCCDTCQRRRNSNRGAGCEYGDLLLQDCPVSSTTSDCDLQLCCSTCGDDVTDSGSGPTFMDCHLSVVFMLFIISKLIVAIRF